MVGRRMSYGVSTTSLCLSSQLGVVETQNVDPIMEMKTHDD